MMRHGWLALECLACLGVWLSVTAAGADEPPRVRVGSKKFTESVILGEMVTHLACAAGADAHHGGRELGGTEILWLALVQGDIDVYPEYTGTLSEVVLKNPRLDEAGLRRALAKQGVRMSRPLGFNNTYAIGMKASAAQKLKIGSISDLQRHPGLTFGFSDEFMNREDGWPPLRKRYRLPQRNVRGLDHDLAYRALESGEIDVTDLYSTDAEIPYYQLRVLADDLGHFPDYDAVLLYRSDLETRAPDVVQALGQLEGRISEAEMAEMNRRAKLDGVDEERVAAEFLKQELGHEIEVFDETVTARLLRRTREHLLLVGISLAAAVVVAIPLGILAARRPAMGHAILGTAGVVQTIPSLALLVMLIPLLGIGGLPAVTALFLYSLLPIVRNTYTGLHDIPGPLRESAEALGLPRGARLRLVELPMAMRSILAGIKTSAVINVGTATLGALVAAGGYGQPIFTGIRLNRNDLILEGAVPAAALALLVQGLFEIVERVCVPRGLRLKRQA